MKERKFDRIIAGILSLILCVSLFAVLAQGNQAFAAGDGPTGIFALRLDNKTQRHIWSAFLLYDEKTDSQYLLADPNVVEYVEQDFTLTLLSQEGAIEAEVIGSDGYFAYLAAPGMNHYRPLLLSENHSDQVYIFVQSVDEKAEIGTGEKFVYQELNTWTESEEGEGIYIKDEEIFGEVMGAPVVKDMSTYEVVGTIGAKDGKIAYFPADDYNFNYAYTVTAPGDDTAAPVIEDDEEEEQPSVSSALVVGILVIAVAAVVMSKKKKPEEETYTEERKEGTVALDPVAKNDFAPLSTPAPQWQVRGMGGAMDGRIFLLTTTLRFGRGAQNDVVFSGNTPGISGSHCQLSFEHGRVVLRDLQSTYGTFLGSQKLEPQVSYNLQNGDTFTLAQGGQTFRLERSGNAVQNMTPAVRSNADGRTYRADMNGCISFGRDQRSEVPFPSNDSSVSTNHCVLYKEGGKLYLKDTNSTNGTFFDVNNRLKPNKPYPVKKGMSFFLVSQQNTFVITED